MRKWIRFIRTTMMLLLCLGGLMWTTQTVSLSQPGNGRVNEAGPKIDVSPVTLSAVQLVDSQIQQTLTITNTGSDTLNWTITEVSGSNGCDSPGDLPWLSILPQSGSISNEPPPGLPEVLPTMADTYVSQGRSTANFGASLQMAVGYDGPGCFPGTDDEASRGLIQVDVSPIPSETSIVAATLNVHADFACFVNQSNVPVTAHRLSESWTEAAVTWETQPSFAEAHGTITVTDVLTWYQLDVTDLVGGWLNETWPNNGIMLQGPESGGSNFSLTRFASREKADGTLAPYLRLTYAGEPNSEDMTVTFDSTGLTPGAYSGTLCVNSNDEMTPIVTVPIELTVSSWIQYLPIIFRNFCPDFFDDFSNLASGWIVLDDSFVRSEYLNGEYRILSKQSGFFYLFSAPTCLRESYVVETDARWSGTPGEAYGLIFGVIPGFDQYYLFDMNTDFRQFRLLRREPSGSFTTIVPITDAPAINGGTTSNHLKVTRNGDQITLEVNGTVLGTWSDGTITGLTDVGVVSIAYNNNPTSDARFDNFSVIKLPATSATTQEPGGAADAGDDSQISGAYRVPVPADVEWRRKDDVESESP